MNKISQSDSPQFVYYVQLKIFSKRKVQQDYISYNQRTYFKCNINFSNINWTELTYLILSLGEICD